MLFRNEKTKKIFGIIWFVVFAYLLYSIGNTSGTANFSLKNYLTDKLNKIIQYFPAGDSSLTSLVKTEVVQEESVVTNVVDKVSPAVVSIVAKTVQFDLFNGPSSQESGIGTGFIVDSSGLIVTNSHVVDNPDAQYSVVLKDGTTYEVNKVNLDEASDLAIIEVTARDLPIVEFGDSDNLKVGQTAIAIGNALGQFQNTLTVGVVSGIGRQIEAGGALGVASKVYESVIQTDAALNPGNSGGPLLNSAGQAIGINVATTPGADNISFAIPINTLKPILQGFLKEGKILRPYMGVYYVMITKQLSALRDLPEGAYISRVLPESPAEQVGLKRGDIITQINDRDLSTQGSLTAALSKYKVGDTVKIKIDREGKSQDFNVTLADTPAPVAQ
jgi:serine protease Do